MCWQTLSTKKTQGPVNLSKPLKLIIKYTLFGSLSQNANTEVEQSL